MSWLPPEPAGPEPDLGAPPEPPPAPAPPQPQAPPPTQAYGNPFAQQPGWQQPPPPPQPSWQPPPPGWYPPPQQPPGWGWQQQAPPVPDNGPAVAGFVLSTVAGTLLVISAGLSSIVSVVCAGLGVVYSLRGRRMVDRGETPKHRSLAQAGFIIGLISLVLAVLATVGWILFFVFADLSQLDDSGNPNGFETSVRALASLSVLTLT